MDRKGRVFSFGNIQHSQKIIALPETDRLMREIGKLGIILLMNPEL
jgi:hypothetical protein